MDQFFKFSYFLNSAIIFIIALCNRLTHIISFIITLSYSLINYDAVDHKSANEISNILLSANSVYDRHPPSPILISTPSHNKILVQRSQQLSTTRVRVQSPQSAASLHLI